MNKMQNSELDYVKREIDMQLSMMKYRLKIDLTILILIFSFAFYIKDVQILIKIFYENDYNVWIYGISILCFIGSILILHLFSISESYKIFYPMTKENESNLQQIIYNHYVNYLKKLQKNEKIAAYCFSFGLGFIVYLLLFGVGLVC